MLCAGYAYRVIGEKERMLAWFWSAGAAFLVSLVFFRVLPDFVFAFAILTALVYGAVFLLDRAATARARARRRQTFKSGRNI